MTIALPEGVESGRVRFRIIKAVLDTDDPGDEPEAIPVEGEITFTASRSTITVEDADTMVAPGPFTIPLVDGEMDERIVATDTEDEDWHYHVEFNLIGVVIEPFDIPVPTDADIDLTDYTPVIIIDGEVTVRGPRGYNPVLEADEVLTLPWGSPATVTISPGVVEGDDFVQQVDFGIPSGKPAPVLVQSGGAYPTRLDSTPHLFMGPTSPESLGVMLDGDTWIDSDETVPAGIPVDMQGIGSPEGVVAAPVGSTWRDNAGTNGAWVWKKRTGTGNTGWWCVEGDTGWRTMTASIAFAVATGNAYLRRVNNTVILRFSGFCPTTSQVVGSILLALPGGFQPITNKLVYTVFTAVTYQTLYVNTSINIGGRMSINPTMTGLSGWASTDTSTGIDDWYTEQAWPTTLPGT